MIKKIPPQLTPIILLTLTIVVVYGTARVLLTPASFGEYGFFRGEAIREISARQPVFSGQESCAECHKAPMADLLKFEHKTLNCETCHWASSDHVNNPKIQTRELSDNLCTRCHTKDPARPVKFKQIEVKNHYDGSCKECHLPHHPAETP
jgi:hypothetical protein